jgi:hypothetical protein
MSLRISFEDFQKMADKECIKRTGQPIEFYPTIWIEDFWPSSLEQDISLQKAKEIIEDCLESVIATLPG